MNSSSLHSSSPSSHHHLPHRHHHRPYPDEALPLLPDSNTTIIKSKKRLYYHQILLGATILDVCLVTLFLLLEAWLPDTLGGGGVLFASGDLLLLAVMRLFILGLFVFGWSPLVRAQAPVSCTLVCTWWSPYLRL